MTNAVEINSIEKSFENVGKVLNGVTFAVGEGEIVGLLGPNGSGKTTLLKTILNLQLADSGTVTFWGKRYTEIDTPISSIAALLDPTWVDERMNVENFIKAQLLMTGLPNSECRDKVDKILTDVNLLKAKKRRISALSLGMRQRVCLACCFVSTPKLMILDEPLNGLDADGVLWLQDLLRNHRDRGGSILLSSHLMAEMQAIADTVAILHQGKIEARGDIESLSSNTRTLIGTNESVESLRTLFINHGYTDVSYDGHYVSVANIDPGQAAHLAFTNNFTVNHLTQEKQSLEEIYRTVTHRGN